MRKITYSAKQQWIFTAFLALLFLHSKAQTTHIDPLGSGGFELGTTLVANGWSTNTPAASAATQWVCSSGVTGLVGVRCAYISDTPAAATPSHTYSNIASASHLFRNITTIPASQSQISLSFDWLCRGESTFDRLRVYAAPTTFTPVFGTEITASGPAPTGIVLLGLTNYSVSPTWQATTVTVPPQYAGTSFKLIFEWRNDASVVNQPPAAIDNISLIASALTSYCIAGGGASTRYINSFSTTGGVANITNSSTYSPSGYGDFTSQALVAPSGSSISFSTAFTGGTFGFNIWVDWNDNFIFEASEKMYASSAYGATFSGAFLIPGSASAGNHRMRIRANWSSTNPDACGVDGSGETEDYTITVQSLPCAGGPSTLTASSITFASATINFTSATPIPALGYVYYYSTSPTTPTFASTGNGTSSTTSFPLSSLNSGNQYYVWIRSNCGGASGMGAWSTPLVFSTPIINDNCAGAILAPVNSGLSCATTISGTTSLATQSQPGCVGTADDDVWYKFVASSTSHTITITQGSLSDSVFQVFSGTCGTLTSLLCSDPVSATVSSLTVGSTYFIRIYSYFSGASNTGTFTLCITTPLPAGANDNCSGAIEAPVNSDMSCTNTITGTTSSATQSTGIPTCVGSPTDDVWYKFTATATSHIISVTENSLYDSVFQVFSGSCVSPVSLLCSDNATSTVNGLTIGNLYFIRIYSYFSDPSDSGSFTLCIRSPVPPCTNGDGSGVSTSCPTSITGGVGLNGVPPPAVTCSSTTGCTTLEVQYLQLGQPTSYSVESIPYAPPYQFGCLANTVDATVDDVWSPIVNLPFNFCFYGINYNQVLISSNGVISFDTTTNIPGGTSTWSFDSNLPSTSLFRNAIFGTYHDINPTIGGIIGWELIQLDTGCRALVASWADVPMFGSSCGNLNYTGMIVLYENTNIIEVHVKEKRICASWNSGNAIIGLQNAAGTIATVAPNRNGLSTDWETTNESWRFKPNGTSITTVSWYEGNSATGPILGTGNTLSVCPETTTNYTAKVAYALCSGAIMNESSSTTVTVSSKGKTWNGSVNSDWSNASNWTPPGVPTNINCIIIPTTANQSVITAAASAFSVDVVSAGRLIIEENHSLEVQQNISVGTNADFTIKNNGSFTQIENAANNGVMKMIRKTQPMYRYDYSYWNSPVTNSSGFTLGALSPLTLSDKYYKWQPHFAGAHGNWVQQGSSTSMLNSVGYIVRAPQTFPVSPAAITKEIYTATFTGTFNNGTILAPIYFGSMPSTVADDKWNLIGNPYPSAIRASSLLSTNSAVVDGTIYLWTHNSALSESNPSPFYGTFITNYSGADYAVWNSLAATAATSGGPVPNGYIAAGASFFIKSKVATGNVIFNNTMRVRGYNDQFLRSAAASPEDDDTEIEKHRIWLNLMNGASAFSQIVVGYADGATLGYDNGLDAERLSSATTAFYSTIVDYNLAIQGRPLPFDPSDIVPLGYVTDLIGEFTIGIHETDPLFVDYDIILEDKILNVMHNLKISPYSFTTIAGRFDERFALRYVDNLLSANDQTNDYLLRAFISNNYLNVASTETIENVIIFDISGKRIVTLTPEKTTINKWEFPFAQGAYFATFKMSNGKEINRKLLH